MRYFEGRPPPALASGTLWEKAQFEVVARNTEIFPGIHAITARSAKPGTLEMYELSLAVATPKGLALVVG